MVLQVMQAILKISVFNLCNYLYTVKLSIVMYIVAGDCVLLVNRALTVSNI